MDKIEHVVLLMMENRSFDSLLGWLYDDKRAPSKHIPALKPGERPYEGLSDPRRQEYENIDASGSIKAMPTRGAKGLGVPNIAPGEKFLEVNTQLFEKEHPGPQDKPTMKGYVRDFIRALRDQGLPADQVARFADQVMQCYTPVQLPVLNGLAEHYAVCDMWFSSVPSQTNPNRAFTLCGTSMGLVDNGFLEKDPRRTRIEDLVGYKLGDDRFETKTIFNALEEGGKTTWMIFGRSALLQNKIAHMVDFLKASVIGQGLMAAIGSDSLEYLRECSSLDVISDYTYRLFPEISKVKNAKSHFANIDDFHAMARAGRLPNFSYLEPDWTLAETGTGADWTQHGPKELLKILLFHQGDDYHPPGNLDAAENLVNRVYNSLIANRRAWEKTLLLITFDEPVGSFDHVPPPYSIPPWGRGRVQTYQDGSMRVLDKGKQGQSNVQGTASQDAAAGGVVLQHNFDFRRYGGRVPAILVSPLVEKGTVFRSDNVPFDHTSIINTILQWRGVPKSEDFGIRTPNAPTFDKVVTLSSPRTDEREVRFWKLSRNPGDPVRFYDRFYLKARSGKYIAGFEERAVIPFSVLSADPTFSEYFPRLAPNPWAPLYFQSVKDRPRSGEITADGKTEVRLVTSDDGVGAYNVLGMWKDSLYCYYFNDYLEGPNSDAETWILEKHDKSPLRFGDRVTITNKGRNSRLIGSTDWGPNPNHLTNENFPGEGLEYWFIEPCKDIDRHLAGPVPPRATGTLILDGGIDRGRWSPESTLAKAVYVAGFCYDPGQDIIFSRMDALQRLVGYAYAYDDLAFLINAVIDCEPIFLDYKGKTWMIELWKGQYGLMTGCEIGVYNRSPKDFPSYYAYLDETIGKRPYDPNPTHNKFFECAKDNELLEMSFTLYRHGKKLFSRGPEKQWWLTGFKWGELSKPEELSVEIEIKFPDDEMKELFKKALIGLGYGYNALGSGAVRFTFDRPKVPFQPRMDQDPDTQSRLAQVNSSNADIVSRYKKLNLASNDPNKINDDEAGFISYYITQYGQSFCTQVVAHLFRKANRTAAQLLDTLVNGLRTASDDAAQAVMRAGYTFSEWIGSLESAARTLGLSLDFSCGVQIENSGPTEHSVRTELIREDFGVLNGDGVLNGEYVVKPPERIAPGAIGRFWIRPGLGGAAGWVVYSPKDGKVKQHFEYGCPSVGENYARAHPTWHSPWLKAGSMTDWARDAKGGHPLKVAFVVGNTAKPREN